MKKKRRTTRAIPLSPGAVMALERAAVHSEHPQDRVVAGFLRFTLGTRARGKDAACISFIALPKLMIKAQFSNEASGNWTPY